MRNNINFLIILALGLFLATPPVALAQQKKSVSLDDIFKKGTFSEKIGIRN